MQMFVLTFVKNLALGILKTLKSLKQLIHMGVFDKVYNIQLWTLCWSAYIVKGDIGQQGQDFPARCLERVTY